MPWSEKEDPIPIGKGEILVHGSNVAILAYGFMVHRALEAAVLMEKEGIHATVVNMRFAKPLDGELIRELAKTHNSFVTYEDHTISNGFSSAVSEFMHDADIHLPLLRLALPDEIIEHGQRKEIFEEFELLPHQAAERIVKFIHAKAEAIVL